MEPEVFILYNTKAKIDPLIEKQLSKKNVSLSKCSRKKGQNLWLNLKMTENAPLIQEWKSQQIFGGGNKNPSIIKELSHISFPNLIELSVHGNEIESIEGFSRIRMPELKRLGLSNNRIISVDDLRKRQWLYIYNNFIQNLSLWAVNAPRFHWASIELNKSDPEELADLGTIVKWESQVVGQLWINNKKRIVKKSVQKIAKQKYSQLNLFYQ